MTQKSVLDMRAADIYAMLLQKAEKKGRSRDEIDAVYRWLLGYKPDQLHERLEQEISYGVLFDEAPDINPKYTKVTGVICGIRVEDIPDKKMRLLRCVDKMVDELSKGKKLEKVLRDDGTPSTVDEYIAACTEMQQKYLNQVRDTIRKAIPDAREILSWGMPTYWKEHNLIHFAAQKKHIGIYPGGEATEVFADKLKDYDISKGTIRIPYSIDLPLALIAEIAQWCRIHNS